MAKTGRPRIEINWDELDKLCTIHATQEEVASWFRCSVDAINDNCKREKGMSFPEYSAQKADVGKSSLRRQMWQLALKGDKTMLIWLSKQHLNFKDQAEQKLNVQGDTAMFTAGVTKVPKDPSEIPS
jgi:hypothetical protein